MLSPTESDFQPDWVSPPGETIGFYPVSTDGFKTADNFRPEQQLYVASWDYGTAQCSRIHQPRASSGAVARWLIRSRLSIPKNPSQAALSPQWPTALMLLTRRFAEISLVVAAGELAASI